MRAALFLALVLTSVSAMPMRARRSMLHGGVKIRSMDVVSCRKEERREREGVEKRDREGLFDLTIFQNPGDRETAAGAISDH